MAGDKLSVRMKIQRFAYQKRKECSLRLAPRKVLMTTLLYNLQLTLGVRKLARGSEKGWSTGYLEGLRGIGAQDGHQGGVASQDYL